MTSSKLTLALLLLIDAQEKRATLPALLNLSLDRLAGVPPFFRSPYAYTPSNPLSLYQSVEPHMGTLFNIQLYAPTEQQAKQAFQAAFARISQLDETLSDYHSDSELSRVSTSLTPVPISDDLFAVLSKGQWLSQQTDGAFDVTLGPLTHLWRQTRRSRTLPTSEILQDALSRSGFHKMHLNPSTHTVSFDVSGMQLDVGGIAKGYAADEALAVLSKLGIESALVAASGDLAFSAAPPAEKGWKIAIDALRRPMLLANAAVSTSGSTEQYFVADGIRYSHILDPKTGLGLTTDITTTVIAPRGIDADGMATAINVLGPERGLAFIEKQPGVAAVIASAEKILAIKPSNQYPLSSTSRHGCAAATASLHYFRHAF